MAVKDIAYFKNKFKAGYKITEQDYQDWLDSFRHISDPIALSDTTGIEAFLSHYRRTDEDVPVGEVEGLLPYLQSLLSNYLTVTTQIAMSQVAGLLDSLSDKLDANQLAAALEGLAITYEDFVNNNMSIALSNDEMEIKRDDVEIVSKKILGGMADISGVYMPSLGIFSGIVEDAVKGHVAYMGVVDRSSFIAIQKHVTIDAEENVNIDAEENVNIDAEVNVNIDAEENVNIDAEENVNINSGKNNGHINIDRVVNTTSSGRLKFFSPSNHVLQQSLPASYTLEDVVGILKAYGLIAK